MRARSLAARTGALGAGAFVSSVCYAVTIRAHLGLGPLYVLQAGVARQLGVTIGHGVMLVGVALVGVAIAMRWRPGPGTLALPFIGGGLLDWLLPHIGTIQGVGARLVAVAVASWFMGLAGALMIRAAIGFAAYDGIMVALGRISGCPLALIRLAMEATVLTAGWVLGGPVGVGTAMTGVLIGPAIQFWLRVLRTPTGARTNVAYDVL